MYDYQGRCVGIAVKRCLSRFFQRHIVDAAGIRIGHQFPGRPGSGIPRRQLGSDLNGLEEDPIIVLPVEDASLVTVEPCRPRYAVQTQPHAFSSGVNLDLRDFTFFERLRKNGDDGVDTVLQGRVCRQVRNKDSGAEDFRSPGEIQFPR